MYRVPGLLSDSAPAERYRFCNLAPFIGDAKTEIRSRFGPFSDAVSLFDAGERTEEIIFF